MQENKNFDSYDVMMTLYVSQSIQNLYGVKHPKKSQRLKVLTCYLFFVKCASNRY